MKTFDPEKKNAVLMGRKTWESIPIRNRPLPGRLNVVLTRSGGSDMETTENDVICGSMPSALELLACSPYSQSIEKIFVIGGGQIFRYILFFPNKGTFFPSLLALLPFLLSFFSVVAYSFHLQ